MEITLTPDIEQALLKQAEQQGTTPEQIALESLRREFVQPLQSVDSPQNYRTLADFLEGYIGVVHSSEHVPGGARMSEDTGKKFTEGMIEKRRQGRL